MIAENGFILLFVGVKQGQLQLFFVGVKRVSCQNCYFEHSVRKGSGDDIETNVFI